MKYLSDMIGIVALSVVMLFTSASFAVADSGSDQSVLGYVNTDNGRTLVVNEHVTVRIGKKTRFYNSKGKEIIAHTLRGHKWIYAEGIGSDDESINAKSIYLMPGFIATKDLSRYPFIKID